MEWTFDGQLYVSPRDADAVLGNDRVSSELVGRRASHVQQSLGHVTRLLLQQVSTVDSRLCRGAQIKTSTSGLRR